MTDKPKSIQEMIDERKKALEVALNEIPKDNTEVILKDTATNLTQIILAILMDVQLELEKWIDYCDEVYSSEEGAAILQEIHGGPKYKTKPEEVGE